MLSGDRRGLLCSKDCSIRHQGITGDSRQDRTIRRSYDLGNPIYAIKAKVRLQSWQDPAINYQTYLPDMIKAPPTVQDYLNLASYNLGKMAGKLATLVGGLTFWQTSPDRLRWPVAGPP